ncbi:FdtA/QdtA family cupin domain-containing protein [Pseudomonas sp. JS3066]|uniref:sugar 3,4-ketoisomerase n=1 Tax=Pseudomonas sp. JS3066 TaxID=3090665 RepID=UPI002E7C2F90|nr:FdtA/QdtA family cupin domain-containing protein [Pseudomonas sp. JS3066]WVK95008.1 FdtA/QdtA family cupin domain-containing protein [Pseudomonas sp. JS3066]
MTLIKWAELVAIGDGRGQLVSLEEHKNIPFEIKRVYYMTDLKPGVPRGFHAHRHLHQVAVCVAGRCRFILDDGVTREEAWLDSPTKGLIIGNMVWREMHDFSEDCVLMVLASEHYDEADYIRKYEHFLEAAKHG